MVDGGKRFHNLTKFLIVSHILSSDENVFIDCVLVADESVFIGGILSIGTAGPVSPHWDLEFVLYNIYRQRSSSYNCGRF